MTYGSCKYHISSEHVTCLFKGVCVWWLEQKKVHYFMCSLLVGILIIMDVLFGLDINRASTAWSFLTLLL